MLKLKTFKNAPTFSALQALAVTIQTGSRADIAAHIAKLQADPLFTGKAKQSMLAKLAALVASNEPQYSIFAEKGNGKLPFVAFSSLPAVTCPGAGACLDFCYSFRAWRFAHSFGRMAQNAYLMRFAPHLITGALSALVAKLGSFDLRLYVDGDFSSVADVDFWFSALASAPSVSAYGYSKSFGELLAHADAGGAMPANYQLNISSGHAHDAATVARVRALPITRGEFIAVSIGRAVKGAEHGTSAVNSAVRAAASRKVWVCGGSCGACTSRGHACGSRAFKGVTIAIAMH